ncbi:hypothetical protein OOT00_13920 [Desulfobotulus sp. H1]|uniref:VCBS repeat-containing protein n=1 Tax=Desulfobotulus pelophilus TaxID=2823377 RepID=A0ABT3NC87_9BACT|nr:hypothetical protein [Desulfobotulus pelophilus]MCW7755082.1 hypothetical protein [Desulfobotulus pelophilus]
MQIVSSSLQMVGISRKEVQTTSSLRMVLENSAEEKQASRSRQQLPVVRVREPVSEDNTRNARRFLKDQDSFLNLSGVRDSGYARIDLDMSKRLVQMILEALTGRKVETPFFRPEPVAEFPKDILSGGTGTAFRFEERVHTRTEQESIFMAQGEVVTADGRTITFSVVQMQYRREESFLAREVNLVDPLVISLNGPVTMDNARFTFDLTANGEQESLSMPSKGAGFLFLDSNGNGRLDDGRELFGTQSGNGFADLALHDSDGNGWIDAGDPVFSKLRIWHPEDGTDGRGVSLEEAGIGAIGLASVATPMDVGGTMGGRIQATGIVLTEKGDVGTVHHLDLKV